MKLPKISMLCLAIFLLFSCKQEKTVYIFSYFNNNGEDGLHLAYSADGYHWEALNNDMSFLKPELSADKLMRDPCIILGGDGLYHLIWTIRKTGKNFLTMRFLCRKEFVMEVFWRFLNVFCPG
jgi:hypothetical protein